MTDNYDNHELSKEELLDLTNEIFPRQRCLSSLMIEVCKNLNGFSFDVMNAVFTVLKHGDNIQHYNLFMTDRPKTDRYGQTSIQFIANQIWNSLS